MHGIDQIIISFCIQMFLMKFLWIFAKMCRFHSEMIYIGHSIDTKLKAENSRMSWKVVHDHE